MSNRTSLRRVIFALLAIICYHDSVPVALQLPCAEPGAFASRYGGVLKDTLKGPGRAACRL